jgi:phage tail protein X
MEAIARGPEIFSMAWRFNGLADLLKNQKDKSTDISNLTDKLASSLDGFFKDYNKNVDQKMVAEVLNMYSKNVADSLQPAYFKKLVKKNSGNFEKIAATIFEKTIFTNREKIDLLLKSPNAKTIENDPAFLIASAFYNQYFTIIDQISSFNEELAAGNRLFVAGLIEMKPDKQFAANANSTIRLTYGQVLPYSPIDAVSYKYYTTLDGVMQKEDSTSWEFKVPAKLKTLWKNKDFGEYGENGELKTCFLSNTDITGGNSGSPVINGEG